MVMRTSLGQIMDQQTEKKEYFNSKYSFSKVTGLKAGMEVYCIPLNLDNGLYMLARHIVKARGPKKGFKGSWYNTSIICKGVNSDGTKNPDALCCQLAKAEYDKYPDSNDYTKRMISGTSYVTYLPVLILSCSSGDAMKFPPTKLSIKNFQFSYLEMSSSSFDSEILRPFIEKLKEDGIVDYEAEGEQLKEQVFNELKRTIIKVSANETKKSVPYERSYSFISFNNTNIGKETEQYKYITNYTKIPKVMNAITDFITMFDSEVDGLCMNWTDSELDKYINEDCARDEKVKEAVQHAEVQEALDRMSGSPLPAKEEQVVTVKETNDDIFGGADEIIGNEEEIPFGDLEEETTPVATTVVEETFEPIDDSVLSMEEGDDFFAGFSDEND